MLEYRYPKGEIDPEIVEYFIMLHRENLSRFEDLEREYTGNAKILDDPLKAPYKPDNRIVVPHGRYMVDMFDGYFIGKAVKVVSEKKFTNEKIIAFARRNGIDDENSELAKIASIYGYAIELIYQDDEANTRVTYLNPKQSFIVYDDTVRKEKFFGVYMYNNYNNVEVYTKNCIIMYKRDEGGVLREIERKTHPFAGLPMIKFLHNEEEIGLYEPAMSMINHYNKAISEKSNDVEYFSDAYLKIIGAEIENKQIENMRDTRIINMYGRAHTGEKVEIDFLAKPSADDIQEHLLDRLEKKIFQMCKVTDLTDERFGTSTGVAKEMKLQDMSNQALVKERKFQEAIDERYRLFFSVPLNGSKEEWLDLKYTFYRNLPQDLEREAELAKSLSGITSQKTILSQLSFIDNVQDELDQIDRENSGEGLNIERVETFRETREQATQEPPEYV